MELTRQQLRNQFKGRLRQGGRFTDEYVRWVEGKILNRHHRRRKLTGDNLF